MTRFLHPNSQLLILTSFTESQGKTLFAFAFRFLRLFASDTGISRNWFWWKRAAAEGRNDAEEWPVQRPEEKGLRSKPPRQRNSHPER